MKMSDVRLLIAGVDPFLGYRVTFEQKYNGFLGGGVFPDVMEDPFWSLAEANLWAELFAATAPPRFVNIRVMSCQIGEEIERRIYRPYPAIPELSDCKCIACAP